MSAAQVLSCLAQDYRHGDMVSLHCHTESQLVYAISGVMLVSVVGVDWVVPSGHALWILPGMAHQVRMTGDVRMRTLLIKRSEHHALPDQCQVIKVSGLLRELIITAIDDRQRAGCKRREELLSELIFTELATARSVLTHVPMPADPRLRQLCTTFIDKPSQEAGLEDWATRLNMSSRTLARLFQKELGMSYGQWRTRTRLVLSLQHLASGASILEVALEHGYQSPSAFTAMFKRIMGYTPSRGGSQANVSDSQ